MSAPSHAATFEGDRNAGPAAATSADVVVEMAGLVSRLIREPESDAVVIPQLMRLSEAVPPGAARGAVESSVAAMSQLRGWLQQLQARQRMHTRFQDISARLSRIEGVQPLMQALADEARRLLDAPLSRLDAVPSGGGLEEAGAPEAPLLVACSGDFLGDLQRMELEPGRSWLALGKVPPAPGPLQFADAQAEISPQARDGALARQIRVEGIQGLIVVPMTHEGRPFGSLMVADRMLRRWSLLDAEALQHLGTLATRAIARAARADAAQRSLRAMSERVLGTRPQAWGRPAEGHGGGESGSATVLLGASAGPVTAAAPSAARGLLAGVPDALRVAYVQQHIGALQRADQLRGTALCRTLLTYIEHGHNARAAAKVLGVHVNTLHNRLESVGSLLPGWDRPERALELHLALTLAQHQAPA